MQLLRQRRLRRLPLSWRLFRLAPWRRCASPVAALSARAHTLTRSRRRAPARRGSASRPAGRERLKARRGAAKTHRSLRCCGVSPSFSFCVGFGLRFCARARSMSRCTRRTQRAARSSVSGFAHAACRGKPFRVASHLVAASHGGAARAHFPDGVRPGCRRGPARKEEEEAKVPAGVCAGTVAACLRPSSPPSTPRRTSDREVLATARRARVRPSSQRSQGSLVERLGARAGPAPARAPASLQHAPYGSHGTQPACARRARRDDLPTRLSTLAAPLCCRHVCSCGSRGRAGRWRARPVN